MFLIALCLIKLSDRFSLSVFVCEYVCMCYAFGMSIGAMWGVRDVLMIVID